MTQPCRVSGCANARAGFSPLCSTHRSRQRRHGAPNQKTIAKADLKPFVRRVKTQIANKPDAKLWSVCDQRWEVTANTWQSAPPKTWFGSVRSAAKEIVRLADNVPARDIVVTTLAMYLLQSDRPALFESETAFRTQLVRRVRGLSNSSFDEWKGASDGRKRRTMTELSPKATEVLGSFLVELFGPAGLRVAQLERKEEEEERRKVADFHRALAEVE